MTALSAEHPPRAFPWAAELDADQLAAFLDDLWGAASGNDDLTTLQAVEEVIAEHDPQSLQPCPLSDRELQVLEQLANGGTYEEAAAALGLAKETIRAHTCRIYHRLGAKSAAQAVAIAVHRAWLPGLRVPRVGEPVRHQGPNAWQVIHRNRAAELRAQPGTPLDIGPYAAPTAARNAALRIRNGEYESFQPAGAFTAAHIRGDLGRWFVRVCFLGEHPGADSSQLMEGAAR